MGHGDRRLLRHLDLFAEDRPSARERLVGELGSATLRLLLPDVYRSALVPARQRVA